MSVLLKNLETEQFVGRSSGWTDQLEQARIFGGAMDALFYCARYQLREMEMQGSDFVILLPEFGSRDRDVPADCLLESGIA